MPRSWWTTALAVVALVAPALAGGSGLQPRSSARGVTSGDDCKASICGGMALYPVAPGTVFYSTFNVPGLPLNQSVSAGARCRGEGRPPGGLGLGLPDRLAAHTSVWQVPHAPSSILLQAIDNDITFFIYTNIFFDGGAGECEQCKMNQFVNQLMLGQPLYGSTGPPNYDPLWMPATTWIFAAQYFMEIYDNATAKAAAGDYYNCTEGEILWTEYSLDDNWHWTLSMGVIGDPSRTSSFVSEQPFMGLLTSNGTSSWSEPAYKNAHLNGCWELYGIAPYGDTHFPSTGSIYDMRTIAGPQQAPIAWQTHWSNVEAPTCPGHPNGTFAEIHNTTQQDVSWLIFYE